MSPIVLASGNRGKLAEFRQLLAHMPWQIAAQSEYAVPEAEETGLSFVENAILKARNAAQHCALPAIADDSGLEVDALRGAPGIYSARFAGPGADDAANNCKLLELLRNTADNERSARFHCVLVYLRHGADPAPLIAHGVWEGSILRAAQGGNGFGYDPLFYVPDQHASAAQLPAELKNRISHRGQAMRQLLALLRPLAT